MKNTTSKLIAILLALVLCLSLAACAGNGGESSTALGASSGTGSLEEQNESMGEKQAIKIGCVQVTEGMVDMIIEALGDEYEVEKIVFDANNLLSETLAAGDTDALVGNGEKYIANFNQEHDTNLQMVGPYFYSCMALYSREYDKVEDIPDGATVIIANDGLNMEISLEILQKAGLITLSEERTGDFYSEVDIVENPKNLQLVGAELTIAIGSLDDAAAVISPCSIAKDSGEIDANDYLCIQDSSALRPMGLVVDGDKAENNEWAEKAMEKLNTQEYYDKFNEIYGGGFTLVHDMDVAE